MCFVGSLRFVFESVMLLGHLPMFVGGFVILPICNADAPRLFFLELGDRSKKFSPARTPLELGGPIHSPGGTLVDFFFGI